MVVWVKLECVRKMVMIKWFSVVRRENGLVKRIYEDFVWVKGECYSKKKSCNKVLCAGEWPVKWL